MQENSYADAERENLRDYLARYSLSISEKHRLERRLSQLRYDMTHPHGGHLQDGRSGRTGWDKRDGGGIALVSKADDIECRILKQIVVACDALLSIFDVMDCLPLLSIERTVLEMRYIDLSPWPAIAKATEASRSMVFIYYNSGLDRLLSVPTIREMVSKYIGSEFPNA